MSRLHIVIGRADRLAAPQVIYCGFDGVAALAARDKSPLPLTEYFRNPRGIRKACLGHAANAAAEAAEDAETERIMQQEYNAAVLAKAVELAAEARAREEAERSKILEEFARAKKDLEATIAQRDAEVKSLREQLEKAPKPSGSS